MELKKWVESYCAKQKDEIKDKLQNFYAFSYTSYIYRKEYEIQGITDFVSHKILLNLNSQDVSTIYDAIDVLNDLSHFLQEMHERQDKLYFYMMHKNIFNRMSQIISAPSDEQKGNLDFFMGNKIEAEKEMSKLKDEIQSFDWNKEEEFYSAWLKGYSKWEESKQMQEIHEQSIEPEM